MYIEQNRSIPVLTKSSIYNGLKKKKKNSEIQMIRQNQNPQSYPKILIQNG